MLKKKQKKTTNWWEIATMFSFLFLGIFLYTLEFISRIYDCGAYIKLAFSIFFFYIFKNSIIQLYKNIIDKNAYEKEMKRRLEKQKEKKASEEAEAQKIAEAEEEAKRKEKGETAQKGNVILNERRKKKLPDLSK